MPTAPDSTRPADAEDPGPRTRPRAALLLGVETLVLTAAATFCFVAASGGGMTARLGVGLGIFLLLFAAGTALAARLARSAAVAVILAAAPAAVHAQAAGPGEPLEAPAGAARRHPQDEGTARPSRRRTLMPWSARSRRTP